jgi:hypothetical protein
LAAPTEPRAAPLAPVSWGELVDKITILEIKAERITAAAAVANVRRELDLLTAALALDPAETAAIAPLRADLRRVNERLWTVEDDIRRCEAEGDFGQAFVALARAVYRLNDERAALKRRINDALGSAIVEEKSYWAKQP